MNKSPPLMYVVDYQPQFSNAMTAEPCLREIIFRYYHAHFSRDTARSLTDTYLAYLANAPNPFPAKCPYDEWKPAKDVA